MNIVDKKGYGEGNITIYPNGDIGYSYHTYRMPRWEEYCYYVFGIDEAPLSFVERRIWSTTARAGCSLYCYKGTRCMRDNLRLSDYKITRDKDKADYCVVPWKEWSDKYYKSLSYNIACKDGGTVYKFNVRRAQKPHEEPDATDEEIENIKNKIKEFLDNEEIEFFYESGLITDKMYYLPKIEAYVDILNDSNYDRSYVYDANIATKYLNEVTPENLQLWSMCDDEAVMEKLLITIDWKTYPFTIANLIRDCNAALDYSDNMNVRMIMEKIGYTACINKVDDVMISPEDFDMYQRWMFLKNNIPEGGGLVNPKDFSLDYAARKLIPHRVAVKPIHLDGPTTLADIRNMVQ